MDIGDSPEEAAFRAEARAFLEQHAEHKMPGVTSVDELNRHDPNWMYDHLQRCREWQHVLYDNGWAGITWPKEFGGRGGTGIQQAIYSEEEAQFDVQAGVFTVGIGMVAPTLMVHGTPEQKERYLDPMLRGDELWCQLFSEPGAGSDLAGSARVRCATATSGSSTGRRCGPRARSTPTGGSCSRAPIPTQPKHRGITYFVVDMNDARHRRAAAAPDHRRRPLQRGVPHRRAHPRARTCSARSTAVGRSRRPRSATSGPSSASVVAAGTPTTSSLSPAIRGVTDDPRFRQEIMQAYIRSATLRYMGLRLRTAMSQGRQPGAEASVLKLAFSAARGAHRRPGDAHPRPGSHVVRRRRARSVALAGLLPEPVQRAHRWRHRRDPEERDRGALARPAARADQRP